MCDMELFAKCVQCVLARQFQPHTHFPCCAFWASRASPAERTKHPNDQPNADCAHTDTTSMHQSQCDAFVVHVTSHSLRPSRAAEAVADGKDECVVSQHFFIRIFYNIKRIHFFFHRVMQSWAQLSPGNRLECSGREKGVLSVQDGRGR